MSFRVAVIALETRKPTGKMPVKADRTRDVSRVSKTFWKSLFSLIQNVLVVNELGQNGWASRFCKVGLEGRELWETRTDEERNDGRGKTRLGRAA